MDPNVAHFNLVEYSKRILEHIDSLEERSQEIEALADIVASSALALDEWLSQGGFLPEKWDKDRK